MAWTSSKNVSEKARVRGRRGCFSCMLTLRHTHQMVDCTEWKSEVADAVKMGGVGMDHRALLAIIQASFFPYLLSVCSLALPCHSPFLFFLPPPSVTLTERREFPQ